MNILTVLVLLVLAAFAVRGYRRGLVRALFSTFFFAFASVLVYFLTPYIRDFLQNVTPFYEMFAERSENFLEGLTTPFLFTLITYVITLILVIILLRLVLRLLGVLTRLPLIRGTNRILGFGFGLLCGLGVVWIAFLVFTFASGTSWGGTLYRMVRESTILDALYRSDLFLRALSRL